MKLRKIDMRPFKLEGQKEDYPMRENLVDILLFEVNGKTAYERNSTRVKIQECKGDWLLLQIEEYAKLKAALDNFHIKGSAKFMMTMIERVNEAELTEDRK